MNRKQGIRSRAHNFRFYALHQGYVTIQGQGGKIWDDYYSKGPGFVFCDKKAVMAQDMVNLTQKRLKTEYNVTCRYGDDFRIQDRLLFIESDRVNYSREFMLCVTSYRDKTGRSEYLDLRCEAGIYAGQAGVQTPEDNLLIVKLPNTEGIIDKLDNLVGSLADYIIRDPDLNRADLVMVGPDYINNFLIRAGESGTGQPGVIVPDTINNVVGKVAGVDYQFVATVITDKPIKVFEAPPSLAIDSNENVLIELTLTK